LNVIVCLLLNIFMNNHDEIFCHKKFYGTCTSVEMLKRYMVRKVGDPCATLYSLKQWLGATTLMGSFGIFRGRESSGKIFLITSIFYIVCIEPLFLVAKIIGSPGKNDLY